MSVVLATCDVIERVMSLYDVMSSLFTGGPAYLDGIYGVTRSINAANFRPRPAQFVFHPTL